MPASPPNRTSCRSKACICRSSPAAISITHCNITGPREIPDETIESDGEAGLRRRDLPMERRGHANGCARMSMTGLCTTIKCTDANARNLIKAGARIMLANDGVVIASEMMFDPMIKKSWMGAPEEITFGLPRHRPFRLVRGDGGKGHGADGDAPRRDPQHRDRLQEGRGSRHAGSRARWPTW